MPRRLLQLLIVSALALLSGCLELQTNNAARPSASAIVSHEAVAGASANDSAWQSIDTAMELRRLPLHAGSLQATATIVRFDPQAYRISVKYDIPNRGYVSEWAAALKPLAVINGGYFDAEGKPTALVIFDGIARGESYDGFGGMVVVNEQGQFELRSLRQQPFDPNEPIKQAMQSAPMLIQPGGTISDFEADDDRSRRSVIARDRDGRILLIAVNAAVFTLRDLAQALDDSDLAIDAALNLDGGRSTGLFVQTESTNVRIDSFEKVPLVLVVDRQAR